MNGTDEHIIYANDDEFQVIYDAGDTDLPIGVADGHADAVYWLGKDEALAVAAAIFSQFGAAVPGVINVTVGQATEGRTFDPSSLFEENGDERESWNAAALQAAIDHRREARFSYAKGENGSVIETRRIEPEAITQTRRGSLVVGWDPDRRDTRAFRLDRIAGFVSVG